MLLVRLQRLKAYAPADLDFVGVQRRWVSDLGDVQQYRSQTLEVVIVSNLGLSPGQPGEQQGREIESS